MDTSADLCRLCRVPNEEQPAEDWPHLFHARNEQLLEKIRACTNVRITEHDPLPKRICFRCQAALELAYSFRVQCDKADARWQRQLVLLEKVREVVDDRGPENVPAREAESVPTPAKGVQTATDGEIRHFFRGPNVKNLWNKRFQCRFCPRHFGRKCRLREHEAQHTGIREDVAEKAKELVPSGCPVVDATQRTDIREEAPQVNKDPIVNEAVVVKEELDIVDVFVVEELPTTEMSEKELESVPILNPVDKSMLEMNDEHDESDIVAEDEQVPVFGSIAEPALQMAVEPPKEEVQYFYRGPNAPNSWNKRFQCRFCPRHFGRKCRLREHELCHNGVQRIPCANCSRRFYTESDLRVHQEQMHGNLPFACGECGNRFKTQAEQIKHALEHLKPRNFQCEFCMKAFRSKYGLDGHKEKKHLQVDYTKLRGQDLNQICVCPHCGHVSHSHNAHVLHLRTHNGEQDSATESESSSTFGIQEVQSS